MRIWIAVVSLLSCAAVSLASLSQPAQADSQSMAAGMQSLPGTLCYQFGVIPGAVGANKLDTSECFGNTFVMPLTWRTFYWWSTSKTVNVVGKAPSGSLLGCTLSVYNSNGSLTAQASANFPTSNSYQTISLTANTITSSSTSFVTCSSIGSATHLMKVDYTP